ncbi:MAG: amidohydrolase family protein [Bacteroidota bacterium]
MKFLLLIFSLIFCFQVLCQDRILIENVRVFDGSQTRENIFIVVEGGQIRYLDKKKPKRFVADTIINGLDKTILPGLINCHMHVWDKSQLKQAFRAGVFALLDMNSPQNYTKALKSEKLQDGYALFYSSGYAATVEGGHGTQYGYEVPTIGKDLIPQDFVAQRKKDGSDYIKILYEPARPTLTLDQVNELVTSAHKEGLLAVAHISNLQDAIKLDSIGVDAFVHVWDNQIADNATIESLAKSGVFVVPTLTLQGRVKSYYNRVGIENNMLDFPDIKENVRRLYEAQVPILAGTDSPNLGINYSSSIYEELEHLVDAGLSPEEALKSATSTPATQFKLEGLGFIAEGKPANFIIVDGNPTDKIKDIAKLESVWIDGKLTHKL